MKTKILVMLGILILSSMALISAHGDFNETKQLIDSNISCDKLSEEQLDEIGDYYMEQMHPGEQHEAMDKMMGGEGSESLRLMHINMGKTLYCGENVSMMGGGMMGMMDMMMNRNSMMGSGGMMNFGGMGDMGSMMSGYYGVGWGLFGWLFSILVIVALVLLIIWLIKQIQKSK